MSRRPTDWSDRWLGTFRSLSTGWAGALESAAPDTDGLRAVRLQRGHLTASWGPAEAPRSTALLWRPLGPEVWEGLLRAWRRNATRRAALLARRLPPAIGEDLRARRQTLLPRRGRDLLASCDCGGSSEAPCVHLAALCLALAERMTDDPLLLLHFRGLEPDVLCASLSAGEPTARAERRVARPRDRAGRVEPPDRWSDPLGRETRDLVEGLDLPVPPLERFRQRLAGTPSPDLPPPPGGRAWWNEASR